MVALPDAPEQIGMELAARAMDRRGVRKPVEQLTVSSDAWTVDDFYAADPA
ncbi:hypothetical protein ACXPWS_29185 [Mycobacterium sp. BMJ-28]